MNFKCFWSNNFHKLHLMTSALFWNWFEQVITSSLLWSYPQIFVWSPFFSSLHRDKGNDFFSLRIGPSFNLTLETYVVLSKLPSNICMPCLQKYISGHDFYSHINLGFCRKINAFSALISQIFPQHLNQPTY